MSASTKEEINWSLLLQSIKKVVKDDDVDKVYHLLSEYESQVWDWMQYAVFDEKRYTRNLVDVVNGSYSLVIMGWNPGQRTHIHSHSGSKCYIKLLDGALREVRYETPEEGKPFKEIENRVIERNGVTHIDDSIGVHELINDSANQVVSLHLFVPPFDTYHCYCRDTAKEIRVSTSFTSTFGVMNKEDSKLSKDSS